MIAFTFPGQGSQKVGMGRAWAAASEAARRTFEEADEALGFPLSRLCFEGPEEELGLTANTQPALLATSIAVHRAIAGSGLEPVAMAGHSLGEYSALVAAGALDFATALRLVRKRGEFMQDAVPVGQGAMAAILGLEADAVAALAADAANAAPPGSGEVCAVANLNGPGQTVIAGHKGAIDRAVALAKERGARKATLLAVSAPFHSPLMRPAREAMAGLLAETEFRDPRVPVVSNVDAAPVTAGAAARDALVRQIDSPVRWVESVLWMAGELGVKTFVEVGPGTVLTGMNRRIAVGTTCAAVGDPDLLRKFLDSQSAEKSAGKAEE
ncbi:MAG: [acyl-carrier-protein] S-malonyltransferase [Acidobacteriota bacterium]|jgi:[acyl-carrier-protein] S-malonyltransferase|nr:[acyl-carrier-protein] S-malonyltransferase [Acidobacteriota bacterium]